MRRVSHYDDAAVVPRRRQFHFFHDRIEDVVGPELQLQDLGQGTAETGKLSPERPRHRVLRRSFGIRGLGDARHVYPGFFDGQYADRLAVASHPDRSVRCIGTRQNHAPIAEAGELRFDSGKRESADSRTNAVAAYDHVVTAAASVRKDCVDAVPAVVETVDRGAHPDWHANLRDMRAEHLVNRLTAHRQSGRISLANDVALRRRKDDLAERIEKPDGARRIESTERRQILHDINVPQRAQRRTLKNHARVGNPELGFQLFDLGVDAPPRRKFEPIPPPFSAKIDDFARVCLLLRSLEAPVHVNNFRISFSLDKLKFPSPCS